VRSTQSAFALAIIIASFVGSAPVSMANGEAPASAWSFTQLRERARQLAQQDFKPADSFPAPDELKKLNYDQYHQIQFRPEHAPWRGESRFQVHFFHRGYLFSDAVKVHLVENGRPREVVFSPKHYNYRGVAAPASLPAHFGVAGFKVLFEPANARHEIASFLGASYFRIIGFRHHYGASARALAIDTGETRAEEFPRFTEFWIEKPAPEAEFLHVYALLDSPSVAGAYRFVIKPGEATVAEVEGSFFARDPERKIGIAPLTSMFLMGESRLRPVSDFRPEVHDSDGLLVRGGPRQSDLEPIAQSGEEARDHPSGLSGLRRLRVAAAGSRIP
jgi:glucans biosynthesis protein